MSLQKAPIEATLNNGLKIIILEIPQATEVTCSFNFKVSRLNETAENAGINLALLRTLHTDNYATTFDQHGDLIAYINYTTLKFSSNADQLGQLFELNARVMAAPVFTENTLKRVLQSHASYRESKRNFIANSWIPLEFDSTCHPIGHTYTPLTTLESAARIDVAHLQQWHHQYYFPGNACLVVAGNVQAQEVIELASQHFEAIPARPIPHSPSLQQPCELDKRHVLYKATTRPRLLLVPDLPGMSEAMADQSSSALAILSMLVDQKIRTLPSVAHGLCLYAQDKYASLFRVCVTASSAEQSLAQLETDIQEMFDEIKFTTLPADEFETARQRALADLAKRDDQEGLVSDIAQLDNYGIPFIRLEQRQRDLRNVTVSGIQRVARTYLSIEQMTVVHILPMQAPTLTTTSELTLSNGLKVITLENPRADEVVCAMNYRVSKRDESIDNAGINTLLYGILVKDPHFVAPRQFVFWNYNDFTQCVGTSDADQLETNFKSLAGIMSTPTLTEETMRQVMDADLVRRERNALFTSNYATPESFDALTFPASGYGNPDLTPASAAQIDLQQVRDWHENFYAAGNACLVVAGNVSAASVEALARKHFDALPRRTTTSTPKVQEISEPGERRISLHRNTKTPRLLVAFNVPGLIEGATDRSTATLQILSALFELNYEDLLPVSSGACIFTQEKHAGLFRISLTAKQADQSLEELETALLQMIEACQLNGIPGEELELAREHAVAKLISSASDDEMVAYYLFQLEDSQLPLALLDQRQNDLLAVSNEDIQRAASAWLTSERKTVAHILPMPASES